MTIDLGELAAAATQDARPVQVTPAFLAQVIAEISAGREALAKLAVLETRRGQCFGLPIGERF